MSDAGLVVNAQGVTKWFAGRTALDQVDLTIGPGRVHGLLGPNGAGKTTLLAILFGLITPDEGTVRLFGRTRPEAGRSWLDGVGGFVETPGFYPYLSGQQNLAVLAGLDGDGAAALIPGMLELVGLSKAKAEKVRGYSLGMRQRLGLAAALIRRPRLLILDEPGNGLDPGALRDLREILRRLAEDGLAVLLSSHDMSQVESVCDGVTVLNQGRVAFSGTLDDLRKAAPDPSWQLSTSDDETALTFAGQLSPGGQRPGIAVRRDEPTGLRVLADRPQLDDYVIQLGRNGIAVRALTQDGTPLESLFFHLTETRPTEPAERQVTRSQLTQARP